MSALRIKAVRWALAALLLFMLISALRLFGAQLLALGANRTMAGWVNSVPAVTEIESVRSRLDFAAALSPGDPAHHESLARLDLIHASSPQLAPEARRALLLTASDEVHTAIRLRPLSPYSWTILLSVKRELGEYDDEFRHALHRAVELGPWEPALLVSLADIGLSAWDAMPDEERALIQQVFVRGLQRQGSRMRDVAQAHRQPCTEQEAQCQ
jgi:hypothetical protein